MKIQKSLEDYLEQILIIHNQKSSVHAVDIANGLGFSKPSVSVAVHKLQKNGYITINENHEIFLTLKGRKIAEKIYERHLFFSQWLVDLGVSLEIALKDACEIEHVISEESFVAIKKLYYNKKLY